MKAAILKINKKIYIWNLLETEKITFYYATIFFIKTRLFILMYQASNDNFANFAIY